MEIENIRDQVDRSSLTTFEIIIASTLRTQLAEDEQLDYFTMIKESCTWLIDKTEPDLESVKGIVETLKSKWNETAFLEYIKLENYTRYEYLKTAKNLDTEIYGLVMGIRATIQYLNELIELLTAGKKLADIYIGFDTPGEFLKLNIDDLNYSRKSILTDLILQLNSELSNEFSNPEKLKSTEKLEFEMLYHPGGASHDWSYLAERLGIEPNEVAELYKLRKEVDNGQYVTTFYSFDRDKRLNYAFLLAIRDYLAFLDSEEVSLNTKESINKSKIVKEKLRSDYKLVLKRKQNDDDGIRMSAILAEAFNVLSPFMESTLTQFMAVFIKDQPLTNKIKWNREVKELQYLLCHLSGEPYKVLDKTSQQYIVRKANTGESILETKDELWARAANCFLNRYGKSMDGGSIQTPNAVRPIPESQVKILDKVISILKRP